MLKIIQVKIFHVKFSQFCSIRNFFLIVDDCNMDECLESSWHLVYYQISGEPGIGPVVVDRTFTSGSVDLRASLFIDHCRVILFFACLIFAVDLDYRHFFYNAMCDSWAFFMPASCTSLSMRKEIFVSAAERVMS